MATGPRTLFQSPYIYLQAAGSNASDGSAAGIHLRWDFLRSLGDNHLPKGNLTSQAGTYPSSIGFNRPDDFVNIFRVRYDKEYSVVVDFNVAPTAIVESTNSKAWFYEFTPFPQNITVKTTVELDFLDIAAYTSLKATVNPATSPLEFVRKYTGTMMINAGDLMFKGLFELATANVGGTVGVSIESVSIKPGEFDTTNTENQFVSARRVFARLDTTEQRTVLGENIGFFRFNSRDVYVKRVTLSTYVNHFTGESFRTGTGAATDIGNWKLVGKFSLDDGNSDNNGQVFKRLEDTTKFTINKRWPKYNDTNSTTGESTVKVQNYKDKWLDPEGLKPAVVQYLTLSKTDEQAIAYLPSEDPADLAQSKISYLDMLKLVSLDFHVARMLGLGHIDQTPLIVVGPFDGGLSTQVVLDYVNNVLHTPTQVRNYVINLAPNSDAVLLAVMNRLVPLTPTQLKDVLLATSRLSDTVLLKAIDNLLLTTTSAIEQVLIANAPLTDNVLLAVINKGILFTNAAVQNILNASWPLSNEVLKGVINRTTPLNAATVEAVMKINSPLSDDILVSLATKSSLLQPINVKEVFILNTPVSALVEQALLSRIPALSISILGPILNGPVLPKFDASKYIYLMVYQTNVPLDGLAGQCTHVFMSLPTARTDFRLPPAPQLKPITYGLLASNASEFPTPLTDANGYTPYADERFINLKRDRFRYENPMETFFQTTEAFSLLQETLPIGYGIEYKLSSESAYRKPEINNDPAYTDPSGMAETIFIPAMDTDFVFNHQEKDPGIHAYGLYSINWFSRVSAVGNQQLTDETKFLKRNTMIPPSNFAVQLIQKENPKIFTTAAEQALLQGMTETDKTLVRTTFDWNYNHIKAYQFGDYAELFFKSAEPLSTRGQILAVTQLSNHQVSVTTKSFTITSTNPVQVVQPNITPGNINHFVGSAFVSNQKTYVVVSVSSTGNGNNPTFILKQLRETSSVDADNNNIFTVSETYISPQATDNFIVVENLADATNWQTKLAKRVYLESFQTVSTLQSAVTNRMYTVKGATVSGTNTIISLAEELPASNGNIVYQKRMVVSAINVSLKRFTVSGNIASQVTPGGTISIRGSLNLDKNYTVVSSSATGGNTNIMVSETLASNDPIGFYLFFNRTLAVTAMNPTNRTMTVAGDQTADINPIYRETVTYEDGTQALVNIGGILSKATITEFEDKDSSGTIITGSRTGVYQISFSNYQLPHHVTPDVDWYKGIVRIIENTAFLPPPDESGRTIAEKKVLDVWEIDRSDSNLKLIVHDGSFDVDASYHPIGSYVPIKTGSNVDVNFHPSYRTYLKADTSGSNNFSQSIILPTTGNGVKQTLMTIRSTDIDQTPSYASYLANPAVLIAQEIVEPMPPKPPVGGKYATPPDYYGKSTYTIDVGVETSNRQPQMLVFYRANERKILDQLYKPATVSNILSDLAALTGNEQTIGSNSTRWNELVNVVLDSSGLFKPVNTGGYRFPIPDNDQYSIPRASLATPAVFPFNGITKPGQMVDIVKEAINGTFLPLTEQPIIYSQLATGMQTSSRPPVIRNNDGQMLYPGDAGYDPFPMATKFVAGSSFVRFTDYTLDGASQNFYFYFAVELSNQFKVSDRSPITGPVLMMNTSPAEEPEIKKIITQLPDSTLMLPSAVRFEINNYVAAENIKKIEIFRTTNPADSLSVRTMKSLGSVEIGEDLVDDFSDVSFPLYGDPLFYRLVAYREILDNDVSAFVPSKPSNVVLTNIVDSLNPNAPELRSKSGQSTSSQLLNVLLTWKPTCYNGTYTLQKLNNSGNWDEVYRVKSNDALIQYPPLGDPALNLPRQDENGNEIYHRYRVVVENTSGLFNIEQRELMLATGIYDIERIDVVNYMDSNNVLNPLVTSDIDKVINHPQFMTFTDISSPLPAGHNTFIGTDVKVSDRFGNTVTKTISNVGGSVTITNGEGGLILDGSVPNQSFNITTKTFTDFAFTGVIKNYNLNYVASPCHDLTHLTNNLIELTDSTHTVSPFLTQQIDDGIAYPGFITIRDISDLTSIGQIFQEMQVKLSDTNGNEFTRTIGSSGDSVTFAPGDGDIELDSTHPNQIYKIEVILKTNLCESGTTFNYVADYISGFPPEG